VAFDCGYTNDECGGYVECLCGPGTQCQSSACVACEPDETFCDNHCGDTIDNCNSPVTCADTCAEDAPGSLCYQGSCCTPRTECGGTECGIQSDYCGGTIDCGDPCEGSQICAPFGFCCAPKTVCEVGDCGLVADNCGGTLDCSTNGCETGTCQSDGHCCQEDAEACVAVNCGSAWNGCKYVACGEQCTGTTACVNNQCQESACKAQGFTCGSAYNDVAGLYEDCGACDDTEVCRDGVCMQVCAER
jgi:hypothetical protein